MSRKSQAVRSVHSANNHAGGAVTTKVQRKRVCRALIDFCSRIQMPFDTIKSVTFEQVKSYLVSRGLPCSTMGPQIDLAHSSISLVQKKHLSVASLHNHLAAIRSAITALGASPDSAGITAENLGLPPKSRRGTKLPVPDEVFTRAIHTAEQLGERGYAIMLKVERYFGHRGQEALMSSEALRKFVFELTEQVATSPELGQARVSDLPYLPLLKIIDGTKGHRPRETAFIGKYLKESFESLREAMSYLQVHPFLIEGKSEGLKSARQKMHFLARKCGLVGQYAPHSLRYRFAIDKLEELRDSGVSYQDALKLCSKYLGHGDSRARYVRMVYGQSFVCTEPRTRRSKSYQAAAIEFEKIAALMAICN